MTKSVLLTTVFSGYNYGSSLQALAGKIMLTELGYNCHLVTQKSLVKGRDIRLNKLITILLRSILLRDKKVSQSLSVYKKSYNKKMIGDSVARFEDFTREYLQPKYLLWNALKRYAKESVACFAGSDQIWNSSTMYVDPMYYLRFAPANKRVAFAPSFGRDFIADYNRKKMGKWISEFAFLSVREDSGVRLIKEITQKKAVQLVDPTLMIDGEKWKQILGIENKASNYILAYFLDKPSVIARKAIDDLRKFLNCEVIAIPYLFDDMNYCDRVVPTGPIEFLDLINNAKCVLTDSFHGTAFSINLHTPFFTFEREYGSANKQSERILSILRRVNLQHRYQPENPVKCLFDLDFNLSESLLKEERIKAYSYVVNALKEIQNNEE